jgi:hypothetical protein
MRILIINLLCILSLLAAVPVEDDVQFENDIILKPEQEDELKDNGRTRTSRLMDSEWIRIIKVAFTLICFNLQLINELFFSFVQARKSLHGIAQNRASFFTIKSVCRDHS